MYLNIKPLSFFSIEILFISKAFRWIDPFSPFISLKQMEKECIHCKSVYDQKNYYQFTCSHVLHYNCAQVTLNNSPGFYGLETISRLFNLNCPECKEPVAEEVFDFKSIERSIFGWHHLLMAQNWMLQRKHLSNYSMWVYIIAK